MRISGLYRINFGHIPSLLMSLAPVLSNYVLFGPISIGDFFFFLAVPWLLANIKITWLNIIIVFISIIIVLSSFIVLFDNGLYAGFYRLAFYFIIFVVALSQANINLNNFFKIYGFLGIFFSLSIIGQWIFYTFVGISFPLQLPIPYYEPDTLTIIDHVFRSGGWFKEPSYFVLYITPLLFFLMQRGKYTAYAIISLAGILSTSSLFFFVFLLSSASVFIRTVRAFFWFFLVIVLFSLLVYLFYDQLLGWIFFSRIFDIFQNGGTLNDRFSPAFDIIRSSTSIIPNKVAYNLVISGGDTGFVWYSSFSSILAALGWIGILFISLNFMRLGIIYGFVFIALLLTSHIFSGVNAVFIALAFLSLRKASEVANTKTQMEN